MDYRIKGFIETSFSDWPGKVAAVLFLPSCNFRCRYCHNHELVLRPEQYPNFPLEGILESLRQKQGWIDGVCLTGGEPTIHPWLPSLIRELRSAGGSTSSGSSWAIKLDTNGTHPEILKKLIDDGLLDYVAMDLKGPLQAGRYGAIAGVSLHDDEMNRIHSSIRILLQGKIDFEFRSTLVPSLIAEEEVYALAHQIRGARRYTLQNFNPQETLDPDLKKVAPWQEAALRRIQKRVNEILRANSESRRPEPGAAPPTGFFRVLDSVS